MTASLEPEQTIALVWSTDDVRERRPDLSPEQHWAVLQEVLRQHDAELGVSWSTIDSVAADLFGPQRRTRRNGGPS